MMQYLERQPIPKTTDFNRDLRAAYMEDFANAVDATVTDEEERMSLDHTGSRTAFVEDAVHFALDHVDRFVPQLRELIRATYLATGKVLFDPHRRGGIFLDARGDIVVMRGASFSADFEGAGYQQLPVMKSLSGTYEVITGPEAGKTFATAERPLWVPSVGRLHQETGEA